MTSLELTQVQSDLVLPEVPVVTPLHRFKGFLSDKVISPLQSTVESLKRTRATLYTIGETAVAATGGIVGLAVIPEGSAFASDGQPATASGASLVCVTPKPENIPCVWPELVGSRQRSINENSDKKFMEPTDSSFRYEMASAIGQCSNDKIVRLSLKRGKNGKSIIYNKQENARTEFLVGYFKNPNNSNDSVTSNGLSVDCDSIMKKKVTFVQMVRNAKGRLVRLKGTKTAKQKSWDNFNHENAFKYLEEGEHISTVTHTSKTPIRLKFTKSQIRRGAYIVERQDYEPRDASYSRNNKPFRTVWGTGFKISSTRKNATFIAEGAAPPRVISFNRKVKN